MDIIATSSRERVGGQKALALLSSWGVKTVWYDLPWKAETTTERRRKRPAIFGSCDTCRHPTAAISEDSDYHPFPVQYSVIRNQVKDNKSYHLTQPFHIWCWQKENKKCYPKACGWCYSSFCLADHKQHQLNLWVSSDRRWSTHDTMLYDSKSVGFWHFSGGPVAPDSHKAPKAGSRVWPLVPGSRLTAPSHEEVFWLLPPLSLTLCESMDCSPLGSVTQDSPDTEILGGFCTTPWGDPLPVGIKPESPTIPTVL